MIRLILSMILTVIVVAFVMVNTHHVTLSFVIGPPIKIRLVFLLMSTFFIGILCTTFAAMVWRLKMKKRQVQHAAESSPALEHAGRPTAQLSH